MFGFVGGAGFGGEESCMSQCLIALNNGEIDENVASTLKQDVREALQTTAKGINEEDKPYTDSIVYWV